MKMKGKFEYAKAETISLFITATQRAARYKDSMLESHDEDEIEKYHRWWKSALMEENALYDVLTLAFNMNEDAVEAIALNAKRDR